MKANRLFECSTSARQKIISGIGSAFAIRVVVAPLLVYVPLLVNEDAAPPRVLLMVTELVFWSRKVPELVKLALVPAFQVPAVQVVVPAKNWTFVIMPSRSVASAVMARVAPGT